MEPSAIKGTTAAGEACTLIIGGEHGGSGVSLLVAGEKGGSIAAITLDFEAALATYEQLGKVLDAIRAERLA